MKLKNYKIKHIVWAFLIAFSSFILLFLFLMQIVFLNGFYELYKTNQLISASNKIINNYSIDSDDLEDIAYEYGLCVSVYSEGASHIISNSYNRGCIIGDTKTNYNFVTSFISSGKTEDTLSFDNVRFGNKTLVKAIKYNSDTFIFLNASIQPLDSSIVLLKSQFGYIAIIIFTISLVVGYFISRQISNPIVEISNSAREIGKGNFKASFLTESKIDEIKELSTALELATKELSKTDELRRDLMANVGHDLKTPLTMIKAYAEMIRDFEEQTKEKREENLEVIIEETDRLTVLVNDILDLSKMQSRTYELKIEEFDLDEIIKKILKRYEILIKNENYNFIYENNDSLFVKADKKRIEQVIYNLLNNAVNYTGEDKTVTLNIVKDKKNCIVEIIDTGKGIDESEINYIWDKYYHNEKKHKRNTYGTGLGLSIVKTILESHGYKYGVVSKKGKGTKFYFEINKCK